VQITVEKCDYKMMCLWQL